MSNFINNILDKSFGLKITRSERNNFEDLDDYTKEKPLYVEFVGLSGVGKSYLFNKLDKEKNKWLGIKNFWQLFSHKENNSLLESIPFYQYLAEEKINRTLKRDWLSTDHLAYFRYFHVVINKDALVYKLNKNYIIISEEGLLHNFGSCIEKLYKIDQNKFRKILKNRAIVYCFAPSKVIADRIIKRRKTSEKLLSQYKVDSRRELLQNIDRDLEIKQRVICLFKEYIPVLEINTADDVKQNAEKVENFIEELQER